MENDVRTSTIESTTSNSITASTKRATNKDKKWLIPDRIKLEVQTESQKENAKLLKSRQHEMKKNGINSRARIEVVDKLLELGELKGKTNGDRMNSFMNCVEENYKKKVNRW